MHEDANEDRKFVKVVMKVGEIIHLLVGFVDSLENEVQEVAARVLSAVAGFYLCTVRYQDWLT